MRLSLLKTNFASAPRRPILYRPRRFPPPVISPRNVSVSAYPYEQEIYLIGKSILAFVFFYTSLNWFHYKRTREEMEEFYTSDAKEIKPKKKEETEKNS